MNRRVARKRATLDMLLSEETDPVHIEQRKQFVAIRDKKELYKYADPEKTNTKEAHMIRAALNRYELIAIGVFSGALDQNSYKRWCRTMLVKDWIHSKAFVHDLRQKSGNPKLYCELQKLAQRWANKDEKPHL